MTRATLLRAAEVLESTQEFLTVQAILSEGGTVELSKPLQFPSQLEMLNLARSLRDMADKEAE